MYMYGISHKPISTNQVFRFSFFIVGETPLRAGEQFMTYQEIQSFALNGN